MLYKFLLLLNIWVYYILSAIIRLNKSKSVIKEKKVAFFPCFFDGNAGYQWRVKKWNEILNSNKIDSEIFQTLSEKDLIIIKSGAHSTYIKLLRHRFRQILKTKNYSAVIVRRELLPLNDYGNLFLEKLLLHFHPNAILDIDDDLSAAKNQPKRIINWYARLALENGDHFNESLKIYKNFFVASKYLANRVRNINPHIQKITILPTCTDYNHFKFKKNDNIIPIIGWIGGDYNYPQLDNLIPILNDVARENNFKLIVVGGTPYSFNNINFDIEFIKWSLEKEKTYINSFDIGIMPLDNSNESKGKGGFKLIQYLGMGVASIATNVTINNDILINENFGLLAEDYSDWKRHLTLLLTDKIERERIALNGRKRAEENYSFDANQEKYIDMIEGNMKINLLK